MAVTYVDAFQILCHTEKLSAGWFSILKDKKGIYFLSPLPRLRIQMQ